MSQNRAMMCAMTFSPPSKHDDTAVKSAAATAEVLLLQPFSQPTHVCFENVPVGSEASRLIKVCNISDVEQTVFIERVPLDKGFSVDAIAFKVAPRGHQMLNVTWKPASAAAGCRVTIPVRSEQGYKGALVLLATTKKSDQRVSRRPQKPHTKTLAQSQQSNMVPGIKTATPARTHTKKLKITVPVEFNLETKALNHCRTRATATQPATKSASLHKAHETNKTASDTLDPTRRETFICSAGPSTVASIAVTATEEFDDSLDANYATSKEIKDTTFTHLSSPQDNEKGGACNGDRFNSDLDFSTRMEALYEKILQTQDPDTDPVASPSYHEFSIRMEERYKRALSLCQSPTGPSAETGSDEPKDGVHDSKLSTPMLPDIADVIADLDHGLNLEGGADDNATGSLLDIIKKYADDGEPLGLEEFFPADLSSIDGSAMSF